MKLTQERLKKLLHYNPSTGVFIWLDDRNNSQIIGSRAGTSNDGYRKIWIDQKPYFAHRLAHFYMNGSFPDGEVDHENQYRDDNRWSNIRQIVTHNENSKNKSISKRNSSGFNGVTWDGDRKKWRAHIGIKINGINKNLNLGRYRTFFAACYARHQANMKHGFHKNHGKARA